MSEMGSMVKHRLCFFPRNKYKALNGDYCDIYERRYCSVEIMAIMAIMAIVAISLLSKNKSDN